MNGALVSTVADLGQALGMSPAEAARWVCEREGHRAMPAELIVDARRAT